MTKTLADSFGSSRKTKWQGTTVHAVWQLGISEGDTIEITRRSASKTRAQALKVAVDRGDLRANGILVPVAAIWTHTSPEQVTLEVVGRKARTLDIWNSWSFDGVDSSWLANAGMIVKSSGNVHELRCSDGLGDADFDDLIVTIQVESGSSV